MRTWLNDQVDLVSLHYWHGPEVKYIRHIISSVLKFPNGNGIGLTVKSGSML